MKKTVVYIGSYSPASGEGIHICEFDRKTGTLTRLFDPVKIENPSYLTFSRDRKRLFSVIETGSFQNVPGGGAAGFLVGADGSLRFAGAQPTRGVDPCHLAVDRTDRFLLTANYTSGSITVFPAAENAAPGEALSVTQHVGSGPVTGRQQSAHAHFVAFTPDDRYLCAVDLGCDRVKFYTLTETGGLLPRPEHDIALRPGSGPRHLVFDAARRRLYVVCELSSEVAVFQYSDDFFFDSVQYISCLPAGFSGPSTAAAVRLSPDGRFLYASNRGHDSIAVFSVSPAGRLTSAGFAPSLGQGPRDIALTPEGDFLLAANETGGNVAVFRRDRQTGVLTPVGEGLRLHRPVSLLFHEI